MTNGRSRRAAGLLLMAAAALGACRGDRVGGSDPAAGAAGGITISPVAPVNLTDNTLAGAANFAWSEFIALNWPAVPQTGQPNTRGVADTNALFGDTTQGPLVWHTFRSKIEIFSRDSTGPNGYDTTAVDYGYDAAPQYQYVSNYQGPAGPTPWINLDENDEIGLTAMYAGVASDVGYTDGLILFTAKANRQEYRYVAANRFFDTTYANPAKRASAAYVTLNSASPPAGSDTIASLPDSTIEIKAAWRALTQAEADSGRFYQTTVRYYRPTTQGDTVFVDTTFGLVALHIIQKTPGQPHFVFATFEQADNILSPTGARVEDENGNLNAGFASLSPTAPMVTSTVASKPDSGYYSPQNIQQLGPPTSDSVPGSRLYYRNTPDIAKNDTVYHDTEGPVAVNRRVHSIPQTIIDANVAAHDAMAAYATENNLPAAVWQYYKLVNVQYAPIDKPAGMPYTGADSATYYLSNSVVETNHNLQVFSGQFQPGFNKDISTDSGTVRVSVNSGTNLITDWCGRNASRAVAGCPPKTDTAFYMDTATFYNVRFNGNAYNMGGCMGCHGNAQLGGSDFSFILGEVNNTKVQTADPVAAPMDTQKFMLIFAAARAGPAGPFHGQ
jgi:hypothetical protein